MQIAKISINPCMYMLFSHSQTIKSSNKTNKKQTNKQKKHLTKNK